MPEQEISTDANVYYLDEDGVPKKVFSESEVSNIIKESELEIKMYLQEFLLRALSAEHPAIDEEGAHNTLHKIKDDYRDFFALKLKLSPQQLVMWWTDIKDSHNDQSLNQENLPAVASDLIQEFAVYQKSRSVADSPILRTA